MEFKEAMRIWGRMCKTGACESCPIPYTEPSECMTWVMTHTELADEIFEEWAEEHPEKTIADDFFEKHPKALRGTGRMKDTPLTCAYQCGYGRSRDDMCGTSYCAECWRRPLEEAHHD